MSSVISAQYAELGFRNITGRYYQDLDSNMENTWATEIGWMNPDVDQEVETYKWLGQSPVLQEWKGGRLLQELAKHSYSLRNRKFEASLKFDVNDIRRDKTGQINIRTSDLAARTATHWEDLLSEVINTNPLCFDGKAFFANNHVIGDSGTFNNTLTASEIASLNVATAASPSQAEMAQIILDLIQHFYTALDNQGKPMNQKARKFVLMVPVNMWGAANGAVRSERLTSGESNVLKASLDEFGIKIVPNPQLSGNTKIYLFRVDALVKPFILQEEIAPTLGLIGAGSEHEFFNDEHIVGVKALRAAGVGIYQYALEATLS